MRLCLAVVDCDLDSITIQRNPRYSKKLAYNLVSRDLIVC